MVKSIDGYYNKGNVLPMVEWLRCFGSKGIAGARNFPDGFVGRCGVMGVGRSLKGLSDGNGMGLFARSDRARQRKNKRNLRGREFVFLIQTAQTAIVSETLKSEG